MRILKKLLIIRQSIRESISYIKILENGQKKSFSILQLAHRLEKGLCISNPDSNRGYSTAFSLVNLLIEEDSSSFEYKVGYSTIAHFIDMKTNIDPSSDKLCKLISSFKKLDSTHDSDYGGTQIIRKESLYDNQFEFLVKSRHSCRDYAEDYVDIDLIKKAIEMANYCPSACNRQPYGVYILSKDEKEKMGFSGDSNAPYFLFITGIVDAYSIDEYHDWIVSPSIFAAYLTIALHSVGLGNCIYRKELFARSDYNEKIKQHFNIRSNEKIILELSVGHYKDEFLVPISKRKPIDEIIRGIDYGKPKE